MDIIGVVKLVWKWRYVTVPLVVLTFVGAIVASGGVQPEFTAQGSLVLVGPASATDDAEPGEVSFTNPLLSQSGALPTSAYLTALSASSPQVARILASEGLSTSYDVAAQDRLPIILLETRATSRDVATNTALRLVELIEEDLRLRQEAADVPPDQQVTADVIAISSAGGGDYSGQERFRVALVLFGLLATVGAAFVLEAVRVRRSLDPQEPREFEQSSDSQAATPPAGSPNLATPSLDDRGLFVDERLQPSER